MGCAGSSHGHRPKDSLDIDFHYRDEIPSWRVDEYLTNHPEIIAKYVKRHSTRFKDLHRVLNIQKTFNEFMLDIVQTHAFTVAHAMYCCLKKKNPYSLNERLSMFVSCLVHDLDHRGQNNQFLVESENPLSNIYKNSQLEHHHFSVTVSILQQEGLNIFSQLNPIMYKELLNNIKSCILATDLSTHFVDKVHIMDIMTKKKFSWKVHEHRLLAQGVTMTACDLSANAKPWNLHREIVAKIFEEFYQQGDDERKRGIEPIPMMDRTKSHYVPQSQVNFLSNICLVCYKILQDLEPETAPLLDGVSDNLAKWKAIAEFTKKMDDSAKAQHPKHERVSQKLSIFDVIRKYGK